MSDGRYPENFNKVSPPFNVNYDSCLMYIVKLVYKNLYVLKLRDC